MKNHSPARRFVKYAMHLLVVILLLVCGGATADLSPAQEQSVVEVRNNHKRMGTAFAITADTFVTANHVVEGEPTVMLVYKGVLHYCTVLKTVPQWDMAILHAPTIKASDPLEFGGKVSVGQDVIIYGFPEFAGYSRSAGNVTVLNSRLMNVYHWRLAATCTALVRGGYSGGPVVDRRTNQVVGILTNRENGMFARNTGGIFTRVDQVQPWVNK